MTKKIKFPLFLKDGFPVRTIEELRENFDLEKIIEYYYTEKLFAWLKDRSYLKELKQLEEVTCQENLLENICNIFSVEYYNDKEISIDVLLKNRKNLAKLQQFTDDNNILGCIDKIAFCQEDLVDILRNKENTIYLCDNEFHLNSNIYKKTFFGIGKVKVIIESDNYEDLLKKKLVFNNIMLLDSKEEPIVTVSLEEAEKLYLMYKIEDAIPLLMQLSELNNARAQFILGMIYADGLSNIQADPNKAIHFFELGESNGDILCKFHKCLFSNNGEALYEELLEPLLQVAESNNVLVLYEIGLYYLQNHKNKNLELLAYYSKLAADKGYWRAWRTCGINYEFGRGVEINYHEAKKYYLKIAKLGDLVGKLYLGELLAYKLNELEEGCKWLKDVYNSETIKAKISDLFLRVDNIAYQYLGDDPSVNRFEMLLGYKTFSSKKDAANYIYLKFENYCKELNKTFSTSNPRFRVLEEYYICCYDNIINDANKLIYIINYFNKKNNLELIVNKADRIKDSLRQLLISNQKTLETSGYYYDPYEYLDDCTEHNGFLNVTKYWINPSIEGKMKEYIIYDNKAYSNEAIVSVKSILKDELSGLNNYYLM